MKILYFCVFVYQGLENILQFGLNFKCMLNYPRLIVWCVVRGPRFLVGFLVRWVVPGLTWGPEALNLPDFVDFFVFLRLRPFVGAPYLTYYRQLLGASGGAPLWTYLICANQLERHTWPTPASCLAPRGGGDMTEFLGIYCTPLSWLISCCISLGVDVAPWCRSCVDTCVHIYIYPYR